MTATADTRNALERHSFYVDGRWIQPDRDETQQVIEAGTGEVFGSAALGSKGDIDKAVRAARRAFDDGEWRSTSAGDRAHLLRRMADALASRADQTAVLCTRENGMPIQTSLAYNGVSPPTLLRMYADYIENTEFEFLRVDPNGSRVVIRREPVGTVGAITPWNFPQTAALFKLAPALAAGCTVVLKHSPETALDSYVIADAAAEAGFPDGVVNVVLGAAEAGRALVTHPDVDKIAFTGSTEVGRWIGAECGQRIRRVTLELGGKSAAIVCDDADLEVFYAGLASATFRNGSQTCTTQSRILAPRSRYDEVVQVVSQFARDMVVGDPLDPATTCGPMASQQHLEKVLGYIAVGKSSGARLVAGGSRPRGLTRGWFVEPTVFADVDNADRLAREEVFGPVIAVIPYDDDDDAVAIANDSNFGLGGSVWSRDDVRALGIARRVRTGTIGLNGYQLSLHAPFGGMKDSGIGRELGPEGLESYFELKTIMGVTDNTGASAMR